MFRSAALALAGCSLVVPAALAAEASLDELQRKLDAARRGQSQKASSAPVAKAASTPPAAPASATARRNASPGARLVVRSEQACRLSVDGRIVGELAPNVTRTFPVEPGESFLECESLAAPGARFLGKEKFERDARTVVQIELRAPGDAVRRPGEVAKPPSAIGAAPQTAPAVVAEVAAAPRTPPSSLPSARESGRLTLTDMYGKKTALDVVRVASAAGVRTWSTGDSIEDRGNVLAVRFGPYVGTVRKGALWKFPLGPSSGTAEVNFDNADSDGTVAWTVKPQGSGFKVEANVEFNVRNYWSSWNARFRFIGTWSAVYDADQHLPATSAMNWRGNFGNGTVERFSTTLN